MDRALDNLTTDPALRSPGEYVLKELVNYVIPEDMIEMLDFVDVVWESSLHRTYSPALLSKFTVHFFPLKTKLNLQARA